MNERPEPPAVSQLGNRSRVWELFDRAAELPVEEQAAFLDAECGRDVERRSFVENLLADDARLQTEPLRDFLESPVRRGQPNPVDSEPSPPSLAGQAGPTHVGRYRLLRLIGEGGMGAVYEAEQDQPRRVVALKVVRAGLSAPSLRQRFILEAQILGRLHHPGIASVFDAGLAEDGQPYFAMELIRGRPLIDYANQNGLDVRSRIGLVAQISDAVQHAHDMGVIHRDLKPANVLVDERGQPKVLDFGVARATASESPSEAGLTQTGQILGTLSYMSPEQVKGPSASIDGRSDVYALGVILFELLAHRLPLSVDQRPLPEAARMILEEDAPRLGSINPACRGDVETIVATALSKSPARRYQTAADLAADLRRWLANEPIVARPASALYHLRKFAQRHQGLVGGTIAAGLALVLGLIGTVLFAIAESRQRTKAEQNASDMLREKGEALFQAYRARIAAAGAALEAHDVGGAKSQLDAAPRDLRDWEWQHLASRLEDSSVVIPMDSGAYTRGGIVESDGRLFTLRIATADVRLTDLETGKERAWTFPPDQGEIICVCPTQLGFRFASRPDSSTLVLYDESARVCCRVRSTEVTGHRFVAVRPDGKQLACLRREAEWFRIVIIDTTTGRETAVCAGHPSNIWANAFSPDGRLLATVGEDRTARLWDSETGQLLFTCRGHTSKTLALAFSPDGSRLATASGDGTVRQWSTTTGLEVEPPYHQHSGDVTSVEYSQDGKWIASAGTDRIVRVWQAVGRRDVAVFHGHTGAVAGLKFTPDGRQIVSYSPAWAMVAGAAGDGTCRIWEVDESSSLPVMNGHTSYVYPVAFSPDGRWIASGGWDNTFRLWDAVTGEACLTLPHVGPIPCLAYSPDGSCLITAAGNNNAPLQIRDPLTAHVRRTIAGPPGMVHALFLHPRGTCVAVVAAEENQKAHTVIYDIRTGQSLVDLPRIALAYSPDGRWLAMADANDHVVHVLNAVTHETVARFKGHEKLPLCAAFDSESRLLATGSQDRTVRLWELDSGEGRILRGHSDEVFSVAFHPRGTRLASAGRDRMVWLWDVARGEEVVRLSGHSSYIWAVAFSPDGNTLASSSGDFTLRLWDTASMNIRLKAKREVAACREEAERLVEALWSPESKPSEIAAAIQANPGYSNPLRQAAMRAVLRRSQ